MPLFEVTRTHEIQAGHRVFGHQGKCQNLHGHRYVFTFYCRNNNLNNLGMVVDFSIIKNTICEWLDNNYDHRLLIWDKDPHAKQLKDIDNSVHIVPYNPTAENIARYLLLEIAPQLLINQNITIYKIKVEETSKCQATCQTD